MSMITSEREEVRTEDPPRDRRLVRRAVAVIALVAVAAVGYVAFAPSGSVEPEGGPHLGHASRTDAATAKELESAGYVDLTGPGIMWEYRPEDPEPASIDPDELEQQVRSVVADRGWDRLENGERDGFLPLSDASDPEHYFNRANLDDGALVDPERPESLVYDQDSGELLAVMFLMPVGSHGAGIIGGRGAWHVHATPMCFGADKMMPVSLPTTDSCPTGETYYPWSSEMLHIWFVGEPFASKMHDS